ncbi:unnamed protein product [Rotaria sp. Silwood1]|nr:unnamed protein product [Rotaria sp. Silwood1]
MSFAAYIYLIVPKIESINKTKKATGLFLLSWFIFTIYMNIAAWKVSKLIFRIILATLAWYSSAAAAIINTTFKKTLLPTGAYKEKGKGKSSTIISTRF